MIPARPFAAAVTASVADRRRIFVLFSAVDAQAQGSAGTCEDADRARGPGLADRAVEGRALACLLCRREAARGRAFADRAEWKRRGQNGCSGSAGRRIPGSPKSRSRSRASGRRKLVRSNAPAECRTITREIVVLDKEPPRPRATDGTRLAASAMPGIARPKTCTPPGSRSCSTRRSTRRCRGRRCMRCCATADAQFPAQPYGSQRRLDEDVHSAGLRRPSVLPARLFRVQDGAAVRLREVHARRRRRAAEVLRVVEHPESRAACPRRRKKSTAPAPSTTSSHRHPRHSACSARPARRRRTRPRRRPPAAKKPKGPPPKPAGLAPAFGWYLRIVADAVHSGAGRTALADDNNDFYPVSLNQDTLRPGTVYADPYGHLLVLVRRVPQTDDAAGVILAVDAQPDGTVARKRFWRGNFLFAQDPALGGPGFKRFRPILRDKNGGLRRLGNSRDREESAVRRLLARPGTARDRSLLRSHG